MDLQIRNLSKTYANGVHALNNVTLTIPRGMFGLLGPNGAGKSTLMRILATLQEPDEGSIHLGDPSLGPAHSIDVVRQKERVRETLGYLPQEFGVYPNVSAERLLEHFAVLKGITERRARREIVERATAADEPVRGAEEEARRLLGRNASALRRRRRAARRSEAHHRRRTHRRPRPCGARALPESAQRAWREHRGHPVHAHRRGRVGAVQPHGDHRPRQDSAGGRAAARSERSCVGESGAGSFLERSSRASSASTP